MKNITINKTYSACLRHLVKCSLGSNLVSRHQMMLRYILIDNVIVRIYYMYMHHVLYIVHVTCTQKYIKNVCTSKRLSTVKCYLE